MLGNLEFLLLLAFLFLLTSPFLAGFAIFRSYRLEKRIVALEGANGAATASTTEPEAPPLPMDDLWHRKPSKTSQPKAPEPAKPENPTAQKPQQSSNNFEQKFAARWLVWLGGITLALGGGFLVKVSIDMGIMTPTLRCLAGVVLGIGLTFGGEVMRRRPGQQKRAARGHHSLPQAVTAAGIACLFAALYAAHGLYGLIGAGLATTALAGTAYLAVGLALMQGPFVAILGLLGGMITPLVVANHQPEALPHFIYLSALTIPALAIARWRQWNALALLTLSGGIAWTLLWLGAAWHHGDGWILGGFLLLLTLGSLFWKRDLALKANIEATKPDDETNSVPWLWGDWQTTALFAALALTILTFLRMDHYQLSSLVTLLVFSAICLTAGRRWPALEPLTLIAGILSLIALAAWHLPQFVPGPEPLVVLDGEPIGQLRHPILPPALVPFTAMAGLLALLFWSFGQFLRRSALRPAIWAGLAVVMPLMLLVIAYWRMGDFELSLPWALTASLLSLLFLATAIREHKTRALDLPLAILALGTIAALSLALVMLLREAWLTVALSLQLPALALLYQRLPLGALRQAALVIAAVVLVRLLFNQVLLTGSPVALPIFNWLLYGYGLPALAFGIAAISLRRRQDNALVVLLEAGALVFTVLLVSFEIRSFFNEGLLTAPSYGFVEQACQSLAWTSLSTACLFLYTRHKRPVLLWGNRLLGLLVVLHGLIGPLGLGNPLNVGIEVGDWPIINLLSLAYLLPALVTGLQSYLAYRQGEVWMMRLAALATLGLIFIDLTLEVRHAFHGSRLDLGPTSDGEWYAYSLAWLIYGLALLGLAIWRKVIALRYISLAVVMLVVGKVFLFDMAALTGFMRALSFLGLGAALIAIGYLYQRFVFTAANLPLQAQNPS